MSILVDREAKRRREHMGQDVYGPGEVGGHIGMKEVLRIWSRPVRHLNSRDVVSALKAVLAQFIMFATEPIVLWLSLLSGFSDALIFTFLASYPLVYQQWGFGTIGIALAFVPCASRTSRLGASADVENLKNPDRLLHRLLLLLPVNPQPACSASERRRITRARRAPVVATLQFVLLLSYS